VAEGLVGYWKDLRREGKDLLTVLLY